MNLQYLAQRCAQHQAVNPETGRCYNVCPEGQKYDPATGCGDLNWFKEHRTFLIAVGVLSGLAYWRFLR